MPVHCISMTGWGSAGLRKPGSIARTLLGRCQVNLLELDCIIIRYSLLVHISSITLLTSAWHFEILGMRGLSALALPLTAMRDLDGTRWRSAQIAHLVQLAYPVFK